MKKILLITYYFPPCGGASVQRWIRLIPYLIKNGWLPTVITTSNGDYPVHDYTLAKKIPPQVRVIRTRTPLISKKFLKISKQQLPQNSLQVGNNVPFFIKLAFWLRINLVFPDIRRIWNKYAYKSALEEIQTNKYDIILTTGPPHSTHLVGLKLTQKIPVKWITDFRDPWTKIHYLQMVKQNLLVRYLNERLENKVVNNADMNLIISKTISDTLPGGNKKILYNGYDPADFNNLSFQNIDKNNLFRVKYVGRIIKGYPVEQVLGWLNEMISEKMIKSMEISFIGSCAEGSYNYPLLNIRYTEFLTHQQALQEMIDSEILLLFIGDWPDNKGVLTTKIFEYLATGNFIIGVGPVDGEAAQILKDSNNGIMIDYTDKMGFIKTVENIHSQFKIRKLSKNSEENISRFSTPEQASKLCYYFEELVKNNIN